MEILRRVQNQAHRDVWVSQTLTALASKITESSRTLSLLDVGAGQLPYRELALDLGFEYKSHDFNQYLPNSRTQGLHVEWPVQEHYYVCDILTIPTAEKFEVILCTEVLEHVPDPVATLGHLVQLLTPGGYLVLTAPLLSLIHQAPFHFSSGLSPFWYRYWFGQLGIDSIEICQHGDYADLTAQEFRRLFSLPGILQVPLSRLTSIFLKSRPDILSSGGFSIFALGQRNG